MQEVVVGLILLPLAVMQVVNMARDLIDPKAEYIPRFVWGVMAFTVALVLVGFIGFDPFDISLVPMALAVTGAAAVWHQAVRLCVARRRLAGGR